MLHSVFPCEVWGILQEQNCMYRFILIKNMVLDVRWWWWWWRAFRILLTSRAGICEFLDQFVSLTACSQLTVHLRRGVVCDSVFTVVWSVTACSPWCGL